MTTRARRQYLLVLTIDHALNDTPNTDMVLDGYIEAVVDNSTAREAIAEGLSWAGPIQVTGLYVAGHVPTYLPYKHEEVSE